MLQFLRTTVLGGILFLVPIIILVFIVGKALALASHLAAPLAEILPIESFAGFAVVNVLAIIILVLVCFSAGLAAKADPAQRFVDSLEDKVLSKIPAYDFLKSKITAMVPADEVEGLKPVLARFDDSWQIAFEVERAKAGIVTLFLPGAPDPWSGSVCYMTEDRVKSLDFGLLSTVNELKGLGKGSVEKLHPYF